MRWSLSQPVSEAAQMNKAAEQQCTIRKISLAQIIYIYTLQAARDLDDGSKLTKTVDPLLV